MHMSSANMLAGAARVQGMQHTTFTFRSFPQSLHPSSAGFAAPRRQRRQASAGSWPCRAAATPLDSTSVDHESPQTSDDEAVFSSRDRDHGHDTPAHRVLDSSHHAASLQSALQSHGRRHQRDGSGDHLQSHVQHEPQQGETQHHQHSGAMAASAPAAATDRSDDGLQVFPSRHVPRWSPLLLAYFPIGCVIGVLRMATWIVLLAVDSALLTNNDTMIQVFYKLLGIRVQWHGSQHLPAGRHVIVSNHVTVGDLMVLYARPRSYVHLITSRLPKRITQARNHRVKLRHASGETYCRLADEGTSGDSIHLFPEGGMTNGRGMMRFSRGFMRFGKGLPIVPAAVRAAPVFGISTHTLTSSFAANMFWFCFAPWVDLEVTVLPPMRPQEGEGNGYFVDRVQRAIADELDVPIADITLQQKHKLYKR